MIVYTEDYGGFRRTLVGLKRDAVSLNALRVREFQTYPRGVEAAAEVSLDARDVRFRRTLVGLKLPAVV